LWHTSKNREKGAVELIYGNKLLSVSKIIFKPNKRGTSYTKRRELGEQYRVVTSVECFFEVTEDDDGVFFMIE
jgi:hypothetical protein